MYAVRNCVTERPMMPADLGVPILSGRVWQVLSLPSSPRQLPVSAHACPRGALREPLLHHLAQAILDGPAPDAARSTRRTFGSASAAGRVAT